MLRGFSSICYFTCFSVVFLFKRFRFEIYIHRFALNSNLIKIHYVVVVSLEMMMMFLLQLVVEIHL